MRTRRSLASLSVLGLLLAAPVAPAATADAAETAPDSGAVAALSAGDRVVARTLYEAQQPAAAEARLSLEEIAGMRRDGRGWLAVFAEMKHRGLIEARNLGRLIARRSGLRNGARRNVDAAPARPADDYLEVGLGAPGDADGGNKETRSMD